MKPYWEALTPKTRDAFQLCAELPFIQDFYLAGGTGLALHLGHRYSVDLDFFSNRAKSVDAKMRSALKKKFRDVPLQLIHDKDATFVGAWRGVGLSFFELVAHPLVEKPLAIDGIELATIRDIGALKLGALFNRASRKDLVDLYFILHHVSLEDLFRVASKKYPLVPSFPYLALDGLGYFADAEMFPMPEMIDQTSWKQMKEFLTLQAADGKHQNFARFWE